MTEKDKKIQELQRALDESQAINWALAGQLKELKERNYQLAEDLNKALACLENAKNLLVEWKLEIEEKEKANQ